MPTNSRQPGKATSQARVSSIFVFRWNAKVGPQSILVAIACSHEGLPPDSECVSLYPRYIVLYLDVRRRCGNSAHEFSICFHLRGKSWPRHSLPLDYDYDYRTHTSKTNGNHGHEHDRSMLASQKIGTVRYAQLRIDRAW